MSDEYVAEGVTFDNLRGALAFIYFGRSGMPETEWQDALAHVVPMKHNFESPIRSLGPEAAKDTYIEYWIDDDDRVTQDHFGQRKRVPADEGEVEEDLEDVMTSEVMKVARCTVRFVGHKGEVWAKIFHHLTKRKDAPNIFIDYCNATGLEYIGPIRPINVDYFGNQNSTVAFDIVFDLVYNEVVCIPAERLGSLRLAVGDLRIEG